MICGRCGLEMRIAKAGVRPEEEDGRLRVYHVNEVRCLNRHCEGYGKMQESRVLLWDGERPQGAEGGGEADMG